jgi:SAM-dependent methyltransferase
MLRGGKPERIFAQCLRETIQGAGDILDIGTSQRFAKELRPYEALFANKNYIAAGYQPIASSDRYACDCHQDILAMTFADSSFDAILCIQVLEHVSNPFTASGELHRVLRPGGKLLVTTPFLVQYHGKGKNEFSPDHGSYPDFWRFTHQGLEQLFSQFRGIRVFPLDGPIEVRLMQFYLTPLLAWPPVRKAIDFIDRPQVDKATTRHLLMAYK